MFKTLSPRLSVMGLLMICAGMAFAADPAPGCSDIQKLPGSAIPRGATVDLVIDNIGTLTPPPGLSKEAYLGQVMRTATGPLNGLDGVNFRIVDSQNPANDSNIQIGVSIGGSHTAVASYRGYDSNGQLSTGSLKLYTDKMDCDGNLRCYDPSQSGYEQGLIDMFRHELFHAFGLSDSNQNNVMLGFMGVNNRGVTPNIDCVKQRALSLRGTTPPPNPSPGVCM